MEAVKNFVSKHPQITSWIVLAIGMVIILVWSAKDVGFTGTQWTALIVTTILLAGVSVWIIGWEDDDDEEEPVAATDQNQPVKQ
jgi:Na+(H+)/acetate symporter ActP